MYTRQADSKGHGPLTITGFAPYQLAHPSGQRTVETAQASSAGFVVLDSVVTSQGTVDTQKEGKRVIKPTSKADGTVQGHVKVNSCFSCNSWLTAVIFSITSFYTKQMV